MEDYTKRMHPAFQRMLASSPTGRIRHPPKMQDPRVTPELPTREELEMLEPLVTVDYTTLELRILAGMESIPEWMGE